MAMHPKRNIRGALAMLTTLVLSTFVMAATASAGKYRLSRGDDLFYNYYVGPAVLAGGGAAQMYPTPVPTPPLVGHTYVTYQPLMPHEFLYKHHRTYYRHHPGQSWVQTKVCWW